MNKRPAKIDAKVEWFNFLGYTIRYDKDLYGRNSRYWNIIPSKKAELKIRENVKIYLSKHGQEMLKLY